MNELKKKTIFELILKGFCPECHEGKITKGFIGMQRVCPHCHYNLNPEPGYYLGAMMVSFFAIALLTIPPVIFLKVSGADDRLIIGYPFVQYLILGPVFTHYSKVIWAHLGYRSTKKEDLRPKS